MPTVANCKAKSRCDNRRLRFFYFLSVAFYLAASTASGELLVQKESWKQLSAPNRPAAQFVFEIQDKISNSLTVRTDKSVAFLYREVSDAASRTSQSLSWRWRLEQPFAHTDLAAKGKDDRPLALHLWFSDPDQPSVFGALGWVLGYPHITHSLTYVLGGEHAPGSVLSNPYYNNGAILVLRGKAVATGRWYTEVRDIERDIKASFPSIPMMKSLKYIAISADTDDTGGDSLARMTDLRLTHAKHD